MLVLLCYAEIKHYHWLKEVTWLGPSNQRTSFQHSRFGCAMVKLDYEIGSRQMKQNLLRTFTNPSCHRKKQASSCLNRSRWNKPIYLSNTSQKHIPVWLDHEAHSHHRGRFHHCLEQCLLRQHLLQPVCLPWTISLWSLGNLLRRVCQLCESLHW